MAPTARGRGFDAFPAGWIPLRVSGPLALGQGGAGPEGRVATGAWPGAAVRVGAAEPRSRGPWPCSAGHTQMHTTKAQENVFWSMGLIFNNLSFELHLLSFLLLPALVNREGETVPSSFLRLK